VLGIMIAYPWMAFATAGVFVVLWLWRRAGSAAVAAALWIAYGVYETLKHVRVLCTGECNIRVDLLLFSRCCSSRTLVALWQTLRRRPAPV
jgi:hypothetical protein